MLDHVEDAGAHCGAPGPHKRHAEHHIARDRRFQIGHELQGAVVGGQQEPEIKVARLEAVAQALFLLPAQFRSL